MLWVARQGMETAMQQHLLAGQFVGAPQFWEYPSGDPAMAALQPRTALVDILDRSNYCLRSEMFHPWWRICGVANVRRRRFVTRLRNNLSGEVWSGDRCDPAPLVDGAHLYCDVLRCAVILGCCE
jgi:hypothetical protein